MLAARMPLVRIIHTSDVHLGAPLGWLGHRAADQREALKGAWSATVDRALSERADCLIVAGDLFDSNNPPASTVRFVLKELDRLASASETETVILPGSHDFLSLGSVYTSYEREFKRIPRTTVLHQALRADLGMPDHHQRIIGTFSIDPVELV